MAAPRPTPPLRGRPPPANASSTFVFTGHGYEYEETPFAERDTLPEGYTLVTFSECATPTLIPDIARTIERMNANPAVFQRLGTDTSKETVAAIESALGRGIRIYRPGDQYPPLTYAPLGDIQPPPDKAGKSYTLYFKSGVHTLPVRLQEFPEWKIGDTMVRHKPTRYTFGSPELHTFAKYSILTLGPNPEAARRSFDGAVFPDTATIDELATETEPRFIPIDEVFAKLGPGVYYWPLCRGSTEGMSAEALAQILDTRAKSQAQQRTRRGAKRRRKTRRTNTRRTH